MTVGASPTCAWPIGLPAAHIAAAWAVTTGRLRRGRSRSTGGAAVLGFLLDLESPCDQPLCIERVPSLQIAHDSFDCLSRECSRRNTPQFSECEQLILQAQRDAQVEPEQRFLGFGSASWPLRLL